MQSFEPALLVVAHGTASPEGAATTARLRRAIAATRPAVPVSLCFLDVAAPSLPDAVAALERPTVVLPLLLSTGYHVQADIPAAVADHADITVARHLGPHGMLVDALADRVAALPGPRPAALALVGAGSSRPDAAAELERTGELLAARYRLPSVATLTMTDDLPAAFAALPPDSAIATYLLAQGRFTASLAQAAPDRLRVAAPLGTHPGVVRLAWLRYDEAVRQRATGEAIEGVL